MTSDILTFQNILLLADFSLKFPYLFQSLNLIVWITSEQFPVSLGILLY